MCGIAGIIYRDGTHEIGRDMTRMLQSMKHRGPDSTGYALYGPPNDGLAVMRYTLAGSNTPRDFEFDERLERHQGRVLQRLKTAGADIREHEQETEYAHRVTFAYEGDPLYGENIGVAVVMQDATPARLRAMYRLAEERLAKHQMPVRWYLVETLPRTARGKINRDMIGTHCAALTQVDWRHILGSAG